jgi:predicted MFS family arabinose efflux permease
MRARTYAERFPRPYWILLTGEAIQSIGYGMIVPFISIYLTDTIGVSATGAGAILAALGVVGVVSQPLGGILADRIGRAGP